MSLEEKTLRLQWSMKRDVRLKSWINSCNTPSIELLKTYAQRSDANHLCCELNRCVVAAVVVGKYWIGLTIACATSVFPSQKWSLKIYRSLKLYPLTCVFVLNFGARNKLERLAQKCSNLEEKLTCN